jgi:hypothetical protein
MKGRIKETILYCEHNYYSRYCGTTVTWVGLCNGRQVCKYISMKNVIILVTVMIITATVSTVIRPGTN